MLVGWLSRPCLPSSLSVSTAKQIEACHPVTHYTGTKMVTNQSSLSRPGGNDFNTYFIFRGLPFFWITYQFLVFFDGLTLKGNTCRLLPRQAVGRDRRPALSHFFTKLGNPPYWLKWVWNRPMAPVQSTGWLIPPPLFSSPRPSPSSPSIVSLCFFPGLVLPGGHLWSPPYTLPALVFSPMFCY